MHVPMPSFVSIISCYYLLRHKTEMFDSEMSQDRLKDNNLICLLSSMIFPTLFDDVEPCLVYIKLILCM